MSCGTRVRYRVDAEGLFGPRLYRMPRPNLKRTHNDAFRNIKEVPSSNQETEMRPAKLLKTDFDQAYSDAPLKLYYVTQKLGAHCELTVAPHGGFLECRAILELFQFDKQGHILGYKKFKGEKSFIDEVDAKLEACNVGLHWLLCTYPLYRAHERDGRGLHVEFLGSDGGGPVPFNEDLLSDVEEAERCIKRWRSMQETQA